MRVGLLPRRSLRKPKFSVSEAQLAETAYAASPSPAVLEDASRDQRAPEVPGVGELAP